MLSWVVVRAGGDPVAVVRTSDGVFVVDARSRTEASTLWTGVYDPDEMAFFAAVTPADGTAIDIGANVGLLAVPLARHLSAAGRLLAIEPIPVNRQRLQQALDLNDLARRRGRRARSGAGNAPFGSGRWRGCFG